MHRPIIDFYAGKGPLTSNGIESVLYLKVNNSLNTDSNLPDIECMQALGTVGFDSGICIFLFCSENIIFVNSVRYMLFNYMLIS